MADLDVLFEACLARLETGGSIEDCLATYPAEAANLSPLLQIVAALQTLGRSKPAANPAAAQAARTRFLEEAQALGQQTPVSIEEAMQACLAMLAAGSTAEQCLGAFPQHAAALQPVMPMLAALQSAGHPAPVRSLSQVAARRQEFLTAAARHANEQEQQVHRKPEPRQSRWTGLAWVFQAPALRWAAILLFVTLLVFAAGRITVSAASEALPGDTLYPVKVVTERIALALTLDDTEHQSLVRELEQRRREEAKAVAAQRRAVDDLTVPGTVASLSEGILNVDGVPVIVPPGAKIVGTPGPGQKVVVKASSDRSGKLVAVAVEYQGVPSTPPAALAGVVATPTPGDGQAPATPSVALAPTLAFTATALAVEPTAMVTTVVATTLPLPLPSNVPVAPPAVLASTSPVQPAQPAGAATAAATSTLPLALPASPTLALAPSKVVTVTPVLPGSTVAPPALAPTTGLTATSVITPVLPMPILTSTPLLAPPAAAPAVQPTPGATARPQILLPTAAPLAELTAVAAKTPAIPTPATAQTAIPTSIRPLGSALTQPAPTAESTLSTPAPIRPTPLRRPTLASSTARSPSVTVGGVIERITSSGWIVGNTRVTRSSGTRVDQSRGAATVGAEVRVSGVRQPGGTVLASRVVVLKPAQSSVTPTRVLPPLFPPLARPTPTAEPTRSETASPIPTAELTPTPYVELTALPPPTAQAVSSPTPALSFPTPTSARAIRTPRAPRTAPRPRTPTPALLPPAATPSLPQVAPTLNRPGATLRPPRATPRLLPSSTPRAPLMPRRTPTPTPRSLPLPPPTGAPLPLP